MNVESKTYNIHEVILNVSRKNTYNKDYINGGGQRYLHGCKQ